MKVKLLRDWLRHGKGQTIEVSSETARWLALSRSDGLIGLPVPDEQESAAVKPRAEKAMRGRAKLKTASAGGN